MNMEDEQDGQQENFDVNAQTDPAVPSDAQSSVETSGIDVVDVQPSPEALATTTPAGPVGMAVQASEPSNESDVLSVDPAPEPPEPTPTTLPVLDNEGNVPQFVDALVAGLELWEEAAAEVPGDPHFTPLPTHKPREELTVYRRSPWGKDVWFDRETMTPVLYQAQPSTPTLASKSREENPLAMSPAQDAADAQRELGSSRTPLLVTIAGAHRHFRDALDERVPLFEARAREIAREEIENAQWVEYCRDRAILGPH